MATDFYAHKSLGLLICNFSYRKTNCKEINQQLYDTTGYYNLPCNWIYNYQL